MRIAATIIIAIGLAIGIYPLADRAYTRHLESQLTVPWEISEWDVSLSEDGVSSETSEDFELLNLVFEEELDEDVDENEDEILLNFNMNEEEQSADSESVQAEETDEAGPGEENPSSGNAGKKKKSKLEAIGRIEIPKIDVNIPILEGTSKKNLKVGAGHITGTSKPGSIGNTALAAHRSHTYGRMFHRLDEVEIGDIIKITTSDGTFEYTVYKIHVVEPDDVSVLYRSKDERVLTLITCTPLYIASHRLVVHAVMR